MPLPDANLAREMAETRPYLDIQEGTESEAEDGERGNDLGHKIVHMARVEYPNAAPQPSVTVGFQHRGSTVDFCRPVLAASNHQTEFLVVIATGSN